MVQRKRRDTLSETKRRLMREQEERTKARVRQLLSPLKEEDSDSEEDWTEVVTRIRQEVRQERKERVRQRADMKAVKSTHVILLRDERVRKGHLPTTTQNTTTQNNKILVELNDFTPIQIDKIHIFSGKTCQ